MYLLDPQLFIHSPLIHIAMTLNTSIELILKSPTMLTNDRKLIQAPPCLGKGARNLQAEGTFITVSSRNIVME